MRERRHREDAPWPGSVATNCVSCYRRWPCEGFQTEEYIAALEAALTRAAAVVDAWKNYPKDVEMDPLFWSIEDLWTALDATRAGADAEEGRD